MPHILIADDDVSGRQLLRDCLERSGHSVALAPDGCVAMEQIHQRLPDLIVLDVMMPRKDGFEVLKELKAQPHTASIPLVILVVPVADPNVFGPHSNWPPGNYYVTRPFSPPALALLLGSMLQGNIPSGSLDQLLQGLKGS